MSDQNNFTKALIFTSKHEGGWANDKADPGGETKYGISQKAYPDLDIKNLTREQAMNLYFKDYWLAAGCDKMLLPMAICVFDTAVNCGVRRAKDWLEEYPNTKAYLANRINYYARLVQRNPSLQRFYKGWINRVVDLRKYIEIISLP